MAKRQAVDFGAAGTPSALNVSELPKPGQLGAVHEEGTKVWQIVKLSATSAAAAAGDVVFWKDRAAYEVTVTEAEAEVASHMNTVAGVVPASKTAGYYFALQVGGKFTNMKAATPTAGDLLIANTSNQGAVIAAATSRPFAIALTTAAGNLCDAFIFIGPV